jgi:hypothetical protein
MGGANLDTKFYFNTIVLDMRKATKELALKLWKENSIWQLIQAVFWFAAVIVYMLWKKDIQLRPARRPRRLSRILDLSQV